MNCRLLATNLFFSVLLFSSGWAAPAIDPITDVTLPAGKSLIVPVTATSSNGRSLTYTVTSSTNGIAVVMHTNNPFWRLSVAQVASSSAPGAYQTPYRGGVATVTNVGNLTFMLFPEYAPHTVNVFQGLTTSGFYNSNTIFHRVSSGFVIQGGDPQTNGTGGLVFTYDDEFNPQAMFSGNGQLALANSGKDTDGSQFFVTLGNQRSLDFRYTIFGQLVRGFDVLTNISNTAVDANDRPLADEIIQTASYVPDTADTVLTLTATNVPGVAGTITVIADDGAGGRATNVFAATLVTDTNSNNQPFIYPNTATNLVGPANKTLTNFISAVELDGEELYWFLSAASQADSLNISTNSGYNQSNNILKTLTYNVTNMDGKIQLFLSATTNYVGPISVYFNVSYNSEWWLYQEYGYTPPNYDQQVYTFVFGDTPISGQSNTVSALAAAPFTNVILATFTNGVPGSSSGNFTAFINWGDDSTNSGVVTANAAGKKAVLGSHAYSYPGTYPVYVRVQSAIGASATILSFVTVTNQATPATNVLTVQVTGQGTVLPDYNNAPLAVGGSYSITATPAATNVLASWTDGNGFVLGTGTNLTFTMSPGLSLTANFVVATPPVLRIVSPSSSRVITNLYSTLATVTGTVSNNAAITSVWYQVNSGGWQAASGTTNWSASFIPAYGVTNVFQAWAVNNFGYVSTTNTVLVKYLAGDVLTVNTNGLGTITPNLNGALLPLGTNYALTAAPASGFAFANWTGSLTTNGATLKFTMASNLTFTANFVDTNKPTVSITNLVSGQRVSNSVFTVRGTARDNWQVRNVVCQINGGGWNSATNINNWTNWAAGVTLISGTNVVQAYAVDTSGNKSHTNTVSFVYIVSDRLTLSVAGKGTVSPNYSNAVLAIGQSYSLTATPGIGFMFSNWTGGTSLPLAVLTNKAALRFVMQSNLVLQANFVDTNRPTVSITNPASGQRASNAVFTVKGKAGDNWQVSNVVCQINGGAWSNAATANGWTNWTAAVNLVPGTNTISAYAIDTSGNLSLTNTVKLDYILSAPLTVQIVGEGTLTPNYNGQFLAISNSYTMKAAATNGFAFYYWGGGVPMSSNPTLTFTMASNLTITANFKDVTKPVAAITFPVANQKWSNSVITVTGKASDNVGVTGVSIQINNGGWTLAQTANGFTNWTAANLPVIFGTNIIQAYAVDAAGNVSVTNEVKILGVLAPESLSGYAAMVKRSGGGSNVVVTWGDSTWSQTGTGNDTNADDYCAGSYTYMQTGPNTAVLTNMDIGMLSRLGTTNVTTVNLTFISATSANCAWTNENGSGTGTMTFSQVSNLVPATLAGETIQTYESNGAAGAVITFNTDGTFTDIEANGNPSNGTYTFTQYSPTVAIIQQNYTDANDAGAVSYAEVICTSATAGQVFHSHYKNPTYDGNPDDAGLGTFKVQ